MSKEDNLNKLNSMQTNQSTEKVKNLKLLEHKIVEIIKKFFNKSDGSTFNKIKYGIVDSINESDNSVNVKLLGQDTVTHNYPNRTNCDLSAGMKVAIQSNNGDMNDAVVIFPCQMTPPRIGFSNAYLYPKLPNSIDSGLVCKSSDKTLKVTMNSTNCLAIYKGTGTGLDNSWTLIQQLSVDGLAATKIFTVGDDTVYGIIGLQSSGYYGLSLYKKQTDGTYKMFGQMGPTLLNNELGCQIGVPFNTSVGQTGTMYFNSTGCHAEGALTIGTGNVNGLYNTFSTNASNGYLQINGNDAFTGSFHVYRNDGTGYYINFVSGLCTGFTNA